MDAGRARVTACALALCVCAAWLAPPALAESSVTPDDADARLDRLLRVANHNPANLMNRAHVKFPTQVRVAPERPRNPPARRPERIPPLPCVALTRARPSAKNERANPRE